MRTHSIIVIGDLHQHPGPRNADRREALDQIIRETLAHPVPPAAWLYVGDIFDALSTIDDRNWWKERVKTQAAVAPVAIVPGNHDRKGDLDIFGDLKAAFAVSILHDPRVYTLPLATRAVAAIGAIPYPSRAGFVAAGVSSADLAQEAALAFAAVLMGMAAELQEAKARGELALVAGHVNLAGSLSSTGQPQIGHDPEIDPVSLARFGRIAKIFGHIHKAQTVHDAIYAGSICRMDFGEVEEKHYLRLDIADDSAYTVTACPIDVAPMWIVEGELTRAGFTWQALTREVNGERMDPPSTWEGTEVKAKVRYEAAAYDVLDWSLVAATFAGAKRFKIEKIARHDRAIRAPEVAAEKTLPDKIVAWCRVTNHVATDGVLRKLARAQAPDRDEIPNEVAALVASMTTFDGAAVTPQEVLL